MIAPARAKGTGYSRKRRNLREHRVEMRIMQDVIEDHGLDDEVQERTIDETGNTGHWLGFHSDLDEASDVEDPELELRKELDELRKELDEKLAFVQVAENMLRQRRIARDLDRARMELEDFRSRANGTP